MEDHRRKAIVLGLEDIDNNLAKYRDTKPPQQKELLNQVLADQQLQWLDKTNTHRRIDGAKLRDFLCKLAGNNKVQPDTPSGDIFKIGSDMLKPAQLAYLHYVKQAAGTDTSGVLGPVSPHQKESSGKGGSKHRIGRQQQDGPSPDFSPLSSVDEDVLREGAALNEKVPALQLVGDTGVETLAEQSGTSVDNSATPVVEASKDPSPADAQVNTSSVAVEVTRSQRVETPSNDVHSNSAPTPSSSTAPAASIAATAYSPHQDAALTSSTSALGSKRPSADTETSSTPASKRQKRSAAPLHPREITGMPIAIPPSLDFGGTIDLTDGLPRPPHTIPRLSTPYNDQVELKLSKMRCKMAHASTTYGQASENGLNAKPAHVARPTERLKQLYLILFGQNAVGSWKDCARHIHDGHVSGYELLQGVLGAAVWDMVFCRPVPWGTPWDEIERFRTSGHAPYYKEAARSLGLDSANQDFIILRAAELQINDPSFQNATVRPVAKDLAEELDSFLRPQLEVLTLVHPNDSASIPFWNKMSAGLTDFFTEALILRGQLDVSPSEFRYTWITSGREFDWEYMTHRPDTSGYVSFSTTPLIECRVRPDSEWYVVAKATGFLKRPEEDE